MSKTKATTTKSSSRRTTRTQPAADLLAKRREPVSRMQRWCAARRNMQDQLSGQGEYFRINLSAMYRAAGQPYGKDPWSWAQRAATVNAAIHQYKWAHEPDRLRLDPVRVLIACDDDELGEFDYPGDCETLHAEIALLYATHVDGKLPEQSPFWNV